MSVINTNVKSLIAQDSLRANNNKLSTAMERLSTGSKINSAKDDAAGLAIGTRMTAQVRGLTMAIKNANDGINLAQTAEGAMTEVTDMLQRMRELAVQAGNSTNTDADRAAMNDEVTQLKAEIDRVAGTTQFNNMNILDGSFNGKLQIGNNANQKMDLAIGSVATTAMGETTNGLSATATKAAVTISGASQNVADYQGASFAVNVNGVNKTVTLPVASNTTVVTGGAATQQNFAVSDVSPDLSVSGQVGALYQKTMTFAAAHSAELEISVNGGVSQTIDISDADYYVDTTKATGAEVVAALQTEFDKNAAFQGANKINVTLDDLGRVKLALASGSGSITMTATTGTLLTGLGGSVATGSSITGAITISEPRLDLSGTTTFDVGNSHFDLTAKIQSHGFQASKLTVDEFVTVYNETAVVNGQAVSQVSKAADGTLTFTENPIAPIGSPFNNGSLVTTITGLSSTSKVSTVFQDASTTFGKEFDLATSLTIASGTNDVLSVKVGDNTAVDLRLRATAAGGGISNLAVFAAEIQDEINRSGAFTGENAVIVQASMDADNKIGLKFSNTAGKPIVLDGTLLSDAATTTLFSTTVIKGTVSTDSTDKFVTINESNYPTGVGFEVMKQRTKDLDTTSDYATFNINVNGIGVIDIDLASYITDAEYDAAAMTGSQLVEVLNAAFADQAQLQGRNAVTASLNANGRVVLQAAGGPAAGGNASIVVSDHSGAGVAGDNLLKGLTGTGTAITSDASGQLVIETAQNAAEYFGIADVTIAAASGNDDLEITVGDGNVVSLKLTAGTYTDAQALADEINERIAESQAFTGGNLVTVSVTTDADAAQGLLFTAANGKAVTVGGELVEDAQGFNKGADFEVEFSGIRSPLGGVDLSAGKAVDLAVTAQDGTVTTRSFELASSGAHVSLSNYASELQSAANAAFADAGVTFTASVSNGQLSLVVNQEEYASFNANGTAITAAFGGAISGTAQQTELDVNKFASMSDVAAAINQDLGGAAIAAYDAASHQWTFAAVIGDNGTASTISLSGSGLSDVQFAGTLSATGLAGDATAAKLSNIDVLSTASATASLASIDNSIEYVSKQRSMLGAIQNRLEHTVNNLTNIVTNTEASRSAIMDADYSKETTALAKSQILTQAATAMLAQANQSAQGVLSLLK